MSKYPKSWPVGGHPEAEAKVRQLQKAGSRWLRASGPGWVAEKQSKLSNIKFGGEDGVFVVWSERETKSVVTPMPHPHYYVMAGVAYKFSGAEPSPLPDGYYLEFNNAFAGYLRFNMGEVIGNEPITGVRPFPVYIVETGKEAGYYAGDTGQRIAPLYFQGSGRIYWSWVFVGAKSLRIERRGEYAESESTTTSYLQGGQSRVFLKGETPFIGRDATVGSDIDQVYFWNLADLGRSGTIGAQIVFPNLPQDVAYVAAATYGKGKPYYVTQSTVVGLDESRIYKGKLEGGVESFVDLQSDYSWVADTDGAYLVVGGYWNNAYIIEVRDAETLDLIKYRRLTNTFIEDVSIGAGRIALSVWSDSGYYLQVWKLTEFFDDTIPINAPAPVVVPQTIVSEDNFGWGPNTVFFQESLSISERRIFTLCAARGYDPNYGEFVPFNKMLLNVYSLDGELKRTFDVSNTDESGRYLETRYASASVHAVKRN